MIKRRHFLAGSTALTVTALANACSRLSTTSLSSDAGPGLGAWQHESPASLGLSANALEVAANELGSRGERQGIVVIRHGKIAFEKYWANEYHKAIPEWKNVSFSSGKSWGSTMVGRAVTQGKMSVDDLVSEYHSSAVSGLNPETTIKHLLTMSSGGTMNMKPSSVRPKKIADNSPPGPGGEYEWYNEAEKGTPPGYGVSIQPGEQYFYDGAPADHLADIVAAAVGKSSHRYILEEVVAPLGCENFSYQPEGVDKKDNVRIGGSVLMSCRDLARLGQLYLNKGRWAGQQLVSESYINDAIKSSENNEGYGYLWWLNYTGRIKAAPTNMYFAAGARGQYCFTLPDQDMVIATMGFGKQALSTEQAWQSLSKVLP